MKGPTQISASRNESFGSNILVIYTGGTFGMVYDEDDSLVPFNLESVLKQIPEIQKLELNITLISLSKLLDSSNVDPNVWIELGRIISDRYSDFDGFVILHGTDTMAFTASALSYSLRGLNKPVILTGAQIPIGQIRSDARENLITALEIASTTKGKRSVVGEVCIYFNYLLLRGNRSQKVRSSTFAAFESQNYPALAESGIEIEFNPQAIMPFTSSNNFELVNHFDPNVGILDVFPGMTENFVKAILQIEGLRGVVLKSFGSGNVPSSKWLTEHLEAAIAKGMVIVNVSQCSGGEVIQGKYETSKRLKELGVISGMDMTTEAALTKLMFLLGGGDDINEIREVLSTSLAGEMDE